MSVIVTRKFGKNGLVIVALAVVLSTLGSVARSQERDPVFDVPALLAPPLEPRVLKITEKDGIVTEEVMFHGGMDGDKRIDIFALFAYPKNAKKLPAFVWNQGGLGQATTYWTDFGAKRGYAVICIDFPLPGYRSTGGYPINSGLELGDNPKKAPIYFGALALLRAVSYLETRLEVDRERIGMAGSSWGGFYTTLMAGIDTRLKAASSMYGTGNLQLGNVWWNGDGKSRHDADHLERWRTTLDPAWRLKKAKTPIAWFTTTNDNFYWMPGINKTYEEAAGSKHLRLVANCDHALTKDVGEQVFTWLDIHLAGKPPFTRVSPVTIEKQGDRLLARWTFDGPRKVVAADLIVSYGDGDWRGRWWITVPATIDGSACTAVIPVSSMACHVSGAITDVDGFRSSTPIVRVAPKDHGLGGARPLPDYNGCGMWGAFEDADLAYLKTHGYPAPEVSSPGKTGDWAAVVKEKWTSPPIYGTVGVPHRFSCWLKAEKATEASLSLRSQTAGKPFVVETKAAVGTEWTEVVIDLTPPGDVVGSLRATLALPTMSTAQLDAVEFRPRTEKSR